jgi:hypothetical protein
VTPDGNRPERYAVMAAKLSFASAVVVLITKVVELAA